MSQPITLTLAQRAPRPLRWLGILLVLGLLSMPFLALLPASHPLAVPSWLLTLSGKILCYAIVAVALDLVWGYAGMLSLGHGIFFALGGSISPGRWRWWCWFPVCWPWFSAGLPFARRSKGSISRS